MTHLSIRGQMNKKQSYSLLLVLIAATSLLAQTPVSPATMSFAVMKEGAIDQRELFPGVSSPATNVDVRRVFAKLPLSFEENRGQVDPRVQYFARSAGCTIFLTDNSAVFQLAGQTINKT